MTHTARTARTLALATSVLATLVLASGCSKKSSSVTSLTAPVVTAGPGPLTMTLDGAPWVSDPLAAGVGASHPLPGAYYIMATRLSGSTITATTIALYNIRGVGTYPLGVNVTNFGGTLTFSEVDGAWWTPFSGDAGSITITTLTPGRIAGTFTCELEPQWGSATGTRRITAGTFDQPILVDTVGPTPDSLGSRMSANVNGRSWNASTIFSIRSLAPFPMLISAGNNLRGSFGLTIVGPLTTGSFALAGATPAAGITFEDSLGTSWGGHMSDPGDGTLVSDDAGSVVITALDGSRVQGTFSVTLAPTAGGTERLTLTSGVLDLAVHMTPSAPPARLREQMRAGLPVMAGRRVPR